MVKKSKVSEDKASKRNMKVEIIACGVLLLGLCGVLYSYGVKKSEPVVEHLVGGCVTSQDFVNINILLQDISSFDNLEKVLNQVYFENGKLYYPEIGNKPNNLPESMAADLAGVKAFFDKVHIYRKAELDGCKAVLANAKMAYAGMK